MIIEINIQVNQNRLNIQIPNTETTIEISNVVAYELSTRKIVTFGETSEIIEKRNPEKWKQVKSEIGFAPAFDVQSFDIKFALAVLWYYVALARSSARPGDQFVLRFLDRIVCNLQFPRYEDLPHERRQEFEYLVQESLGLHTLSINQEFAGWPKWQRKAADWSLRLINLLLMGGVGIFGHMRYVQKTGEAITHRQDIFFTIVSLCVVIAAGLVFFYFVMFLGAVLWMVIVGRFLPKDLLSVTVAQSKGTCFTKVQI